MFHTRLSFFMVVTNFRHTSRLVMYPTFAALLDATAEDLCEQGEVILVEDNQTDGSFMLHHFISLFIQSQATVCLVAVAQKLNHYSTIGRKLGIDLLSSQKDGQLEFINGLKRLRDLELGQGIPDNKQHPIDLERLYRGIKDSVEKLPKPTLLVLDNLIPLLSMTDKDSLRKFLHYCYSLTHMKNLCLLSLIHCDTDVVDTDVLYIRDSLAYQMSIHIYVKGLTTGHSSDVHGQVEVTRFIKEESGIRKEKKIMQYKVNNRGVDFFPPGTSAAVL